jgi:hypothetical protein
MDRDTLAERLARVRRRIESGVPYSPDWAAAMEDFEAVHAAERSPTVTSDGMSPPRPEARAT